MQHYEAPEIKTPEPVSDEVNHSAAQEEETYEAGLVRRFREWMHQHDLNEKSFKEAYEFDVSNLKRWGTGERNIPKGRAQEMEDVISGKKQPNN